MKYEHWKEVMIVALVVGLLVVLADPPKAQSTTLQAHKIIYPQVQIAGIPTAHDMVYLFSPGGGTLPPPVNNLENLPYVVPQGKMLVLTGVANPSAIGTTILAEIYFDGKVVLGVSNFANLGFTGIVGSAQSPMAIPSGIVAPSGVTVSTDLPVALLGYLADA